MRIYTLPVQREAHCCACRDLSIAQLHTVPTCERFCGACDLRPRTSESGYVINLQRLFQAADDDFRADLISFLRRGCELYCRRTLRAIDWPLWKRCQFPICAGTGDLFDSVQMLTMQHDALLQ